MNFSNFENLIRKLDPLFREGMAYQNSLYTVSSLLGDELIDNPYSTGMASAVDVLLDTLFVGKNEMLIIRVKEFLYRPVDESEEVEDFLTDMEKYFKEETLLLDDMASFFDE
jgi:hypothetical protein